MFEHFDKRSLSCLLSPLHYLNLLEINIVGKNISVLNNGIHCHVTQEQ